MIKEIFIILLIEFLIATLLAYFIKGRFNTGRFWLYFSDLISVIFYFVMILWLIKFSTFPILDEIFELALSFFLVSFSLIILVFILGVELGNFLESIFKTKK